MADTMVTKIIEIDVKASAEASAHMKAIADGLKEVEAGSSKAGNAIKDMTSWVKGLVVFQIFDLVGGTVMKMASALQEASDKSKILEQRMNIVTHSSEEAGAAFQSIIDISVRQGRELDGVAKLYERVQRSSESLALSQKGVALITEGVAASLRLAGAGTQEANAAMLQFSQALASGKLGGDEFRSMMENDSVLMKALADQLHTTMGGLREMSKEGKLTADVLRNAFLDMGNDGENMMQRMIRITGTLPKTFEQAVTGVKTELVNLVNALQQTGDKTEGIFTKIAMKLSQGMAESAQLIRDRAFVNEEIAKALGKKVEQKMPDEPIETVIAQRRQGMLDKANTDFIKAKNALDDYTHRNYGDKDLDATVEYRDLEQAVTKASAAVIANQQLVARGLQTADDVGIFNEYTTGKPDKPPGKPAKEHGAFDTDVFKQIQREIDAEANNISAKHFEKLPWEATAENLIRKLEDARDKMTNAQLKAAEEWIKSHVETNYYNKKEAEFSRFIMEKEQASEERQIGADTREFEKSAREHDAAVKKATDAYNKEHLTKDPFEGAEEQIKPLRDLWLDSRTTDAQAAVLASAMHEIHAKAAKQLFGEKDPLKDVAHQMGDVWESEFNRMEDDLFDFSKSVKDIFGDMVLSILKDFAKIEAKQQLQPLMQAGKDWITNTATPFITSLFSATGNAFEGGIRMFGQGGVLSGPTPFSYNGGRNAGVGGEAGPEALVPLRRGADGNLGMAQAPVQVIIQNNGSNTKATASETTTPGGGRQITVMINDMVESSLGSGRFDNTLSKSFGISRRGT